MPLIMMTRRRDNENVGKAERRLIKARVSRGTEHRAVIVLNIRYLLRLNTLRMMMNLLVILVMCKKNKSSKMKSTAEKKFPVNNLSSKSSHLLYEETLTLMRFLQINCKNKTIFCVFFFKEPNK